MQRRSLLKHLASAAALAAAPRAMSASEATWYEQFHAALARNPRLLGYLGLQQDELTSEPIRIEGKIPAALRGTLYRNGPARHEIGQFRYQHAFDGDGMVQAFQISDRGVRHHGRFVATHKYKQERETGRAMFPTFGTTPPDPVPVTSPDVINPANISMLAHHGKLYALWEAGSAYEIDAASLSTLGVKTWSPESKGVPFSAHPRVEPDGTLWNFGYLSSANSIVLWHIDAHGKLVKNGVIKADAVTMIHDCIVTDRSLVLLIPPLHYVPESGTTFLDMHQWNGDKPTRVLVVDKNDFSQYRWYELPPQWVFHYGNAWEENGVIRFDAAHSANADVVFGPLRDVMRGKDDTPAAPPSAYSYRIDTRSGKTVQTPLTPTVSVEFPTVDPRVIGTRYRRVVMTGGTHQSLLGFDSVMAINVDTGNIDRHRYANGELPEEHLYVPDPSKAPETGGWILGTTLDVIHKQTRLNIFDAERVSAGPLAIAVLPYALPLGLHGKFVWS